MLGRASTCRHGVCDNRCCESPWAYLTDADQEQDSADWHFGLMSGGEVVACVSVSPQAQYQVRIRQMAVAPAHQRKAMGSQLIRTLEAELTRRGFIQANMQARLSARGFYEKLGYQVVSEPFVALSIDHVEMHKRLD